MPTKTRDHLPLYALLVALGLGALGQFFLAQREIPWTLLPGLLLYGLAAWAFRKALPARAPLKIPPSTPFKASEAAALLAILIIALAMRTYRYSDFPTGIFTDEACTAWGGLLISHEHFNLLAHLREVLIFVPSLAYWASVWFTFSDPTQTSFFFFSVTIALLAFPGIYWTFRQLAGPRAALLTLFILAVMRWHITYSRSGHSAAETLIYIFGSLSLWIYAFRTGKKWLILPAALLMTAGFYSYRGFLAFIPLLAIYFLYEWTHDRWKVKKLGWAFAAANLGALVAGWPIFKFIIGNGGLAYPGPANPGNEGTFFHFTFDGQGFLALCRHFMGTLLIFNRQGDSWLVHNLPYHRMLDDVTGVLFVFGFFLALTRLSERKFAYSIMGLVVMSQSAFLSANPSNASRMMGTVPFVAFLAASALEAIWNRAGQILPPLWAGGRIWVVGALLTLMAFQNFQVYFGEQSENLECRRGDCLEETIIGNTIQREGNSCEYYLSPRFFGHYTVNFLGYFQRSHTHELALPMGLTLSPGPDGRDVLFILEEGKMGVLNLLQSLYPGGQTTFTRGPEGHNILYYYQVPANLVEAGRRKTTEFLNTPFGLQGFYLLSADWNARPAQVRNDPLLNFTFRNDFLNGPFPPLSIRWTGHLIVPRAGLYHFLALTTDSAQVLIDQRKIFSRENTESEAIALWGGAHKFEALYQKTSGMDSAFSLLWKKPGDPNFEVVPASAFRAH